MEDSVPSWRMIDLLDFVNKGLGWGVIFTSVGGMVWVLRGFFMKEENVSAQASFFAVVSLCIFLVAFFTNRYQRRLIDETIKKYGQRPF